MDHHIRNLTNNIFLLNDENSVSQINSQQGLRTEKKKSLKRVMHMYLCEVLHYLHLLTRKITTQNVIRIIITPNDKMFQHFALL